MSEVRQPRVLLACDFFLRYTATLADGVQRAGAEVALLSRDHDQEFGDRPGAAADFIAGAAPGVRRISLPGRVRSLSGLAGTRRARRSARELRPDVVHLQQSIGNDPRLLFAAGARRGRFALTVHDPVRHPQERLSHLGTGLNRALVRAAGLIFVHAEALRAELERVVAPRAPVVVVPHGVELGAVDPLPERPRVLFFGRLEHYKGVGLLLDAMADVWEALPDAELTIAGRGEVADHPALADPRVRLRVEHVPEQDVRGLFAAASCVALPYLQASQSGVGSLAKQYARPIVASDVGGLPELVADGSGLTVPVGDREALASALLRILADRALAAEIGQAGRHGAETGADWRSVGEATLRAYAEHLPGRRDRAGV